MNLHKVNIFLENLQSISVLAVSPEGTVRLWPSLAHEGSYVEMTADLGGNLCNFVTAVKVSYWNSVQHQRIF